VIQDQNLYGSHPFHMEVQASNGAAHGVFMRSSNGMDVLLGTNALTYKIVGGILDLTVLVGPTPTAVVAQYHRLIGTPHMPPLWSLGFHQASTE
jgi:alpha-glucosidase (family GH31 glycosyl hydrolase)